MNKVILSGNLCKEIELKQTQSGKSALNNSVAVRRDFKDADGTYQTDFIDFIAFGNQAEYLKKYASTGGHQLYKINEILPNGDLILQDSRYQGDLEDVN